jgi:hypothetical protein
MKRHSRNTVQNDFYFKKPLENLDQMTSVAQASSEGENGE